MTRGGIFVRLVYNGAKSEGREQVPLSVVQQPFCEKHTLDKPEGLSSVLVRVMGVEPTRLAAQEPKSCTSANSVIPAYHSLLYASAKDL